MASACTVIGGLWRRPGARPGRRRPSAGARVSIELSPVGYLEIDEPRTPGFREPFGRGFHCSFHCLHWKRILETNGGRSPRFQDDRAPFFRFFSVSNGNPVLRTTRGRIGILPPSGRFSRRPRTALRPPPAVRTEDRPAGPLRSIDTSYSVRSPRTWRRRSRPSAHQSSRLAVGGFDSSLSFGGLVYQSGAAFGQSGPRGPSSAGSIGFPSVPGRPSSRASS